MNTGTKFTLLMLTGGRPEMAALTVSSLLFQLPRGTVFDLWDNGSQPVLATPAFRGLVEAATEFCGWTFLYHRQEWNDNNGLPVKEATDALALDGLVLFSDDDCLFLPGAVEKLVAAMESYRVASPVKIELFDRGFPDFTGQRRVTLEEGRSGPAPDHYRYLEGTPPFEVPFVSGTFLCWASDLRGAWKAVPVDFDTVSTLDMPGPKAVVPAAEVLHMVHARPSSEWSAFSVHSLFVDGWLDVRQERRSRLGD